MTSTGVPPAHLQPGQDREGYSGVPLLARTGYPWPGQDRGYPGVSLWPGLGYPYGQLKTGLPPGQDWGAMRRAVSLLRFRRRTFLFQLCFFHEGQDLTWESRYRKSHVFSYFRKSHKGRDWRWESLLGTRSL